MTKRLVNEVGESGREWGKVGPTPLCSVRDSVSSSPFQVDSSSSHPPGFTPYLSVLLSPGRYVRGAYSGFVYYESLGVRRVVLSSLGSSLGRVTPARRGKVLEFVASCEAERRLRHAKREARLGKFIEYRGGL